jgi:hypothetical protein
MAYNCGAQDGLLTCVPKFATSLGMSNKVLLTSL